MPLFELSYYLLCHAAALAGVAVAAIRVASLRRGGKAHSRESRFLAFIASMGVGTLGMTYGYMLEAAGVENVFAFKALSAFSLEGLAGTVALTPLLASSFSSHKRQRTALHAFFVLGAALALTSPIAIYTFSPSDSIAITAAAWQAASLVAAIIYSIVNLRRGIAKLRLSEDPDDGRWARILKGLAAASIAIAPFPVLFDLIGLHRIVGFRAPSFLPLLAGIFSATYVANSVRTDEPPAKSVPSKAVWPGMGLTPREEEVARLLVEGNSYTGIAKRLGIAPATVKTHVLRVYEKTGAGNKLELLLFSQGGAVESSKSNATPQPRGPLPRVH